MTTATPPADRRPVFTIHAVLDGFPLDVSFQGAAEQLPATLERLRSLGAVPPGKAALAQVEQEREAPVCPYHGPMKESTKAPGTYFCPKKMGDGSYCKERHPA